MTKLEIVLDEASDKLSVNATSKDAGLLLRMLHSAMGVVLTPPAQQLVQPVPAGTVLVP